MIKIPILFTVMTMTISLRFVHTENKTAIDESIDALVELKLKDSSSSKRMIIAYIIDIYIFVKSNCLRILVLSGLNLEWHNYTKISCKLATDPSCTLMWFHEPTTNEISFRLSFKSSLNRAWLAVGFNTIKKMIGTNVVMIKLSDQGMVLFNG